MSTKKKIIAAISIADTFAAMKKYDAVCNDVEAYQRKYYPDFSPATVLNFRSYREAAPYSENVAFWDEVVDGFIEANKGR